MTTLTHKDKRDLNRRARAHGLPDLWPEAEELAKRFHHQMRESYERALYAAGTESPLGSIGLIGLSGMSNPHLERMLGQAQGGSHYNFPGVPFLAVDPSSFYSGQMFPEEWIVRKSSRFDGWLGDLMWPELIVEFSEAIGESLSGLFRRMTLRMSGR